VKAVSRYLGSNDWGKTVLTEINIDGMIGPTHHYGGLGVGNLASHAHRDQVSNPRQAALEGLAKAKLVSDLGVPQFVWLPPRRPNRELFDALGFSGGISQQIEEAYHTSPRILSAAFSSAFMWAANSATVTPAVDANDGRYHFTPANLISSLHRTSEAKERTLDLANIFSDQLWHSLHDPLPGIVALRDEGAANHMRMSDPSGKIGFNVFVYGGDEFVEPKIGQNSVSSDAKFATTFLARHTKAASEAIVRRHRLNPDTTFFLRQHPKAISAGVFHNDVIATSHEGILIHHELAFIDAETELARLEKVFHERVGKPLMRVVVPDEVLTLSEAVESYLFNSQLLTPQLQNHNAQQPRMVLVCPQQCQTIVSAHQVLQKLVADPTNPIDEVRFVSVGQSMAGGGGPACLRLRVPADERTMSQLPSVGRMSSKLFNALSAVIEKHYPDHVTLASFCDDRFREHLHTIELALQAVCFSGS
jgi:succinylarginine dihydrolase